MDLKLVIYRRGYVNLNIFQEYEEIKKMVGKEKWESIDEYINKMHPELRLDQIIYNSNNWIEFEKWFYKN